MQPSEGSPQSYPPAVARTRDQFLRSALLSKRASLLTASIYAFRNMVEAGRPQSCRQAS